MLEYRTIPTKMESVPAGSRFLKGIVLSVLDTCGKGGVPVALRSQEVIGGPTPNRRRSRQCEVLLHISEYAN